MKFFLPLILSFSILLSGFASAQNYTEMSCRELLAEEKLSSLEIEKLENVKVTMEKAGQELVDLQKEKTSNKLWGYAKGAIGLILGSFTAYVIHKMNRGVSGADPARLFQIGTFGLFGTPSLMASYGSIKNLVFKDKDIEKNIQKQQDIIIRAMVIADGGVDEIEKQISIQKENLSLIKLAEKTCK